MPPPWTPADDASGTVAMPDPADTNPPAAAAVATASGTSSPTATAPAVDAGDTAAQPDPAAANPPATTAVADAGATNPPGPPSSERYQRSVRSTRPCRRLRPP